LSSAVFDALRGAPEVLQYSEPLPAPRSDDFQVTLWVLQELRMRTIDGVRADWEDEPSLAALRSTLAGAQETELRRELVPPAMAADDIPGAIADLVHGDEGPSLSEWMEANGELTHMREFVAHRAAYQLKEADPHSFAIPRLEAGRAQSALLKIQFDEYGAAEPGQSHAELFANTMGALDVAFDLDVLPAVTLRTNTVLNTFAAKRRLLGACLGHLAVFEMTSVEPMARYAATLRRLLPPDEATTAARFFDVHVAADGFHQELALDEMVTGFAAQYPDEASELLFGAMAVMAVERELTVHLLEAWTQGKSSLRAKGERAAA
jgi:hypothetical protein